MRRTKIAIAITTVAVMVAPLLTDSVRADGPAGVLVPIGSDYQEPTLELFARAAADHDGDGEVRILVIPITFSLDAFTTTRRERRDNLDLADFRRSQVEDACMVVTAGTGATCRVELVPTLVRADAFLDSNLAYFDGEIDGMYVLGGDQTVAMRLVQNTPLEAAMQAAHDAGAAFGGNSAGAAVQSRTMIAGYVGDNGAAEGLRRGAIDVWTDEGDADDERGLTFGLADVITDQHGFERGRMGRGLNVAMEQTMPILAMDAATGAVVRDETIVSDVAGLTSGFVIDPITLDATAAWQGPTSTLSARDIAVHVLAPGGDGFDLGAMQPTRDGAAVPAPDFGDRAYPAFGTPAGAGTLLLGGGDQTGIVRNRFRQLAGGAQARIVVLAAGYDRKVDARADLAALAAAFQPNVRSTVKTYVLDPDAPGNEAAITAALSTATGVWLTAPDRSTVAEALAGSSGVIDAMHARWLAGATVLADDAAAAAMGGTFAAQPNLDDNEEAYLELIDGAITYGAGLGWVDGLTVEPRLMPGYLWPELLRVVAQEPGRLAVGVDVGTAIEIGGGGATVSGTSAAVVVDGRSATFGDGTNGSLSASWLVVDTFTNGELLVT